jgi:hypothetical protein
MTVSVFGRIVPRATVEQAVLDTLQTWTPTYLAEIERQTGRTPGALRLPRRWRRVTRFPVETDDANTPFVTVISPGSGAPPMMHRAGQWEATYSIAVGVLCQARDEQDARDLADAYAAALTAILAHHPTVGLDAHTAWLGFDSSDSPQGDVTKAALVNTFAVVVPNVLTRAAGPDQPIPDPDPQHPYPPPDPFLDAEIDVTVEEPA